MPGLGTSDTLLGEMMELMLSHERAHVTITSSFSATGDSNLLLPL